MPVWSNAWIAVLLVALAGCSIDSPVSRALGARCDIKDECDERCLAPSPEFPGGICTLSCAVDDDCPARASCADVEGGVCLFNCLTEAHCEFLGEGWLCQVLAGRGGGEVLVCVGED